MKRTLITTLVALGAICAAPDMASAQTAEERAASDALLSTTSAALIPVTTTYFVLRFQIEQETNERRERVKRLERIVLIERYLDENESDVRFAFTLGAGEPLDELAALFGARPGDALATSARRPMWREILALTDRRERATRLHDALELALTTNHTRGGAR